MKEWLRGVLLFGVRLVLAERERVSKPVKCYKKMENDIILLDYTTEVRLQS